MAKHSNRSKDYKSNQNNRLRLIIRYPATLLANSTRWIGPVVLHILLARELFLRLLSRFRVGESTTSTLRSTIYFGVLYNIDWSIEYTVIYERIIPRRKSKDEERMECLQKQWQPFHITGSSISIVILMSDVQQQTFLKIHGTADVKYDTRCVSFFHDELCPWFRDRGSTWRGKLFLNVARNWAKKGIFLCAVCADDFVVYSWPQFVDYSPQSFEILSQ